MVDLSFIRDIIAIASFIIALTYYILNIQHQQKTRQTQMFMQIYQRWSNTETSQQVWDMLSWTWEDFREYVKKYGPSNPDKIATSQSHFNYYDGLGLLLKKKSVDRDTVYQTLGRRIIIFWFKFETVIKDQRLMDDPGSDFLHNFEFLAEEMIKIRIREGFPLPLIRLHKSSTLHSKYTNP